jgi:myo-inositol catabolism protein IolC
MDKTTYGYSKPIIILPFDHRSSFSKNMLGVDEKDLTSEHIEKISHLKETIFFGLKKAIEEGLVPKEHAGILCDEKFGANVLDEARQYGVATAVCVEKSGQKEFMLEFDEAYGAHINRFSPTFVKALVRYNPEDDKEMNTRQQSRLKQLSEFCHSNGYKFLIEPLVVATEAQLTSVGGDVGRYDLELRPKLMQVMVAELLDSGVEVDVWKIEGLTKSEDYTSFMKVARKEGRDNVVAIILGRGSSQDVVESWLSAGAKVDGVVGFAIGRSIFHAALMSYLQGTQSREEAIEQIKSNFVHFYNVFTSAKTA